MGARPEGLKELLHAQKPLANVCPHGHPHRVWFPRAFWSCWRAPHVRSILSRNTSLRLAALLAEQDTPCKTAFHCLFHPTGNPLLRVFGALRRWSTGNGPTRTCCRAVLWVD